MLVVEYFHRHCIGWAADRAQAASNTRFVILQHGRRRLERIDVVLLEELGFDRFINVELIEGNQLETIFRAHVHTTVTHYALVGIINCLYMACEAALGLDPGLLFVITNLNF